MCHGMGLTASAVGERITLVWSLSQLLRELDLTSLSGLFGVTAAIITSRDAVAPQRPASSQQHPNASAL